MTIANSLRRMLNPPRVMTPEEMAQIEKIRMKLHENERADRILHEMRENIYWEQMGHNELHKSLKKVNESQNIRTILADVYEKIRNPTISEKDNQRNVKYLDSLLASGKITSERYDLALKRGSAKDISYDSNCPCGSAKAFRDCHL